MTPACLSGALREAVDEVLEKMFFAEAEGPAGQDRPPEELVAAHVDFEGSPSGTLSLRITWEAARGLAADFLGEEVCDIAAEGVLEVMRELTNMICGSVLSLVESDTTFRLSPPAAAIETARVAEESHGPISHCVALANGALSVAVHYRGAVS